MQELVAKILGYAFGAWRFRWYMMAIAWGVCLVGWVMVFRLPDQWEVTAKVFVDTQSKLAPLLQGLTVQSSASARVDTMTQTLTSRPNLEKVARMTDMDLDAETDKEREQIVNALARDLAIKRERGHNIYAISYRSHDPQLANRVVQSMLNILVEDTLGANRKDSNEAQQFLETQLREYEVRLTTAEDRLKEFKRKNVGVMPGQGGGYYKRMEESQNALRNVRLELREARIRRDEIKKQLDQTKPTITKAPVPRFDRPQSEKPSPTAPLDARIQSLQNKLDSLRLNYTDKHPDVIALNEQIDQLKQQRLEMLGVIKKNASKEERKRAAALAEENPVYMEMKVAMAQAEAEVASLQVRESEFAQRVEGLKEMVDTVPKVEAELARLNRDYTVNQRKYEQLLSRLEQARISQEADQNADTIKFKVIDPPRVPKVPTGPNRGLLFSATFVGAILGGIALAVALSMLRPVYDSRRVLAAATGLPVLGQVTMIWTPAQQWRRRTSLFAFVTAAVSLFAVFIGVLALNTVGLDKLYGLPGVGKFL